MSYARLIRELDAGVDLDFVNARNLLAALLDGGVPELETAALLLVLRQQAPGLAAWLGMEAALADRLSTFTAPDVSYRTIVLPSYHGVREHMHLTPLLALLLKSFGIPVLVHGVLDGGGGTAAAYVFRELGVMPCSHIAQVNTQLAEHHIAFAPAALLSAGLASLLALRARLGVETIATRLAVTANVLGERSVRLTPASHEAELASMAAVHDALGGRALLLRGCEGEAFSDAQRAPQIQFFHDGICESLCAAQGCVPGVAPLPPRDVQRTAAWARDVLNGDQAVPLSIRNQLAACLYASGYTDDLTQARAITSIRSFGRIAA